MGFLDELKGIIPEGSDLTDALVKRQLRRKLLEGLEQIPPAKIRQAIQERVKVTDLLGLLPQEKQGAIMAQAQRYGYIAGMFTNDDLVKMLPNWVKDILDDEDGYGWLNRELNGIRQMLKEILKEASDAGHGSNRGRDNQSGAVRDKVEGTRVFTYRPREAKAGAAEASTDKTSGASGDTVPPVG